jgi:HlyD family secretion protein
MPPQSDLNSNFFVRHRGWILALAVLLAVVLLAAFMSLRSGEIPVRAATVSRSTIRSLISTNGKITPVQNFEAHALAAAAVKRVLVHEGDRVKAGQLLVQLEDSDARSQAARALAQLRAAQASSEAIRTGGTREEVLTTQSDLVKARTERDAARRNLDAMRRLQQKGAASLGEVHEAENQLERAEAQLNLLQEKLSDRYSRPEVEKVRAEELEAQTAYDAAQAVLRNSNLRSPMAGIVYSLPIRTGGFVNTGDLLVQVADLSTVEVHAFVDEPDIARLAPGEPVEVTWDALPGRKWQGAVTRVPSEVKKLGTRNVGEVTCRVSNSDSKLLPNTNVNVNIISAEHRDVLTLPREAVHQDSNQPWVFQVSNGELKQRNVTVGISNLTTAEITGVSENALVALGATNGQPLRNGASVRVVR